MKIYTLKNKKGIIIGYIYFFMSYKIKLYKNSKQFVVEFIRNLQRTKAGFAGFYKKSELEKILRKFIFFNDKVRARDFKHLPRFKIQRANIVYIIKNSLIKCHNLFPIKKILKIFIFPCFNKFIEKQMNGVSGFVPRQNVIYIFLHPRAKNFEKRLKYTVAHEFYHAVSDKYCKKWNKSILGSLISEGLANNFRLKAVDGKLTPGLIALSKKQCREIWPKVKRILSSENPKTFWALFFGGKEYPLWTGYTLGYQIVKSFLKKYPKMKWYEVIKIKPETILKESGWE